MSEVTEKNVEQFLEDMLKDVAMVGNADENGVQIRNVRTFEELGFGRVRGVRIRTEDGSEFQISIVKSA